VVDTLLSSVNLIVAPLPLIVKVKEPGNKDSLYLERSNEIAWNSDAVYPPKIKSAVSLPKTKVRYWPYIVLDIDEPDIDESYHKLPLPNLFP